MSPFNHVTSLMRYIFWIAIIALHGCSTDISVPLVITGTVTEISDTSATFSAKITNTGDSHIVETGFIWSLNSMDEYGIKLRNEASVEEFFTLTTNKIPIPGKQCFVRAYIRTEHAIYYGNEQTFEIPGGPVELSGKWTFENSFDVEFLANRSGKIHLIGKSNDGISLLLNGDIYTLTYQGSNISVITPVDNLSEIEDAWIISNKTYVMVGNQMSVLNVLDGSLTAKAILELAAENYTSFVIANDIYLLPNNPKAHKPPGWKFSTSNNSWERIADPPNGSTASFSSDLSGFACGRGIGNFWEYKSVQNIWINRGYYPSSACEWFIFHGGFGYVEGSKFIVRYDPIFNYWVNIERDRTRLFSRNEIFYSHLGKLRVVVPSFAKILLYSFEE